MTTPNVERAGARPGWTGPLGRAVLLAGILLLLLVGRAGAHANLVKSDPPAGARLARPPSAIQLWFSEPLEPSFSQAVVYNTAQQQVDAGDSHVAPADPESLILHLKPNVPPGSYAIAWVTQSRIDGHIVRGIVPFEIGTGPAAGAAAAAPAVASGAVSGAPPEMLLRWLMLLSAAVLVGSFAFWALQHGLPPVGRTSPVSVSEYAGPDRAYGDVGGSDAPEPLVTLRQQRWLAQLALVVFLTSSAGFIVDQSAIAANQSPLQALGTPLLSTLATDFGRFWLARMLLAALLGALLVAGPKAADRRPSWAGDVLALGLGATLLATFSLTSHSAAVGSLSLLGTADDWLHLAATAVWAGGLAQLAVVTSTPGAFRTGQARQQRGRLVARFAVVATVALGVVGATGIGEGLLHVATLDNLVNTGYGQALLVKVVLILPLGAVAAVNHWVVRPPLARAARATDRRTLAAADTAAQLLRWTVRLEVALIIAVIAVVGVLTSLSPPVEYSAVSGYGPVSLTQPSGDLVTTLAIAPAQPGPNTVTVTLRTPDGGVPTGITAVYLRLSDLDQDLGTSQEVLAAQGPGQFTANSGNLALPGRWEAQVIVRRAGQDDLWTTFGLDVTPAGARSLAAFSEIQLGALFYAALGAAILGAVVLALAAWRRPRRWLLRFGVVGAVVLIGGAYGAWQELAIARAEAVTAVLSLDHPATPASIAAGALVYRDNCAVCHGISLQGDGPLAAALSPPPANLIVHVPLHSDAVLVNWITHGYPNSAMPAWGSKLSQDQIWDVLNYLKSVADPRNE